MAFLERFEVYAKSKSIDRHLKGIIHELLRSFMRICNMSIKITRNKPLLLVKVFLFNDNGLSNEMITSSRG